MIPLLSGRRSRIILATIFVILCWAYSPTGIRIGLHSFSPGQLALLRFLIASVFMGGVAICLKIVPPRRGDLPLLLALGFFAVTLHHIALNYGQQGVSAAAASVLAQSTPIFSLLIARLIIKEQITLWRWGCILAGLAGAIVVVAGDAFLHRTHFDAHGLLILVAAISWSLYFSLQKHHAQKYDTLSMVCYTVWGGTVCLCVYLPGLVAAAVKAPLRVDIAVGLLGIFPSALAYLAWAWVLSHADISRASISLYLVPPAAMYMAAIVLGEHASMSVMVGGCIILASVLALHSEPCG